MDYKLQREGFSAVTDSPKSACQWAKGPVLAVLPDFTEVTCERIPSRVIGYMALRLPDGSVIDPW